MIVVLLGALFGAGATALVYGLCPPKPALADVLASLNDGPAPFDKTCRPDATEEAWVTRLGWRAVPLIRALGFPTPSLRRDLAVCGTREENHLAGKATCATIGLVIPWAVGLVLSLADTGAGWWMPLAGSLTLAVALFFVPDLTVRRKSAQRRREMGHTLCLVLDLTVIALAGGVGVQQALTQAINAPSGWSAARLRHALHLAQLTRTSPWDRLGELGRRLEVGDLTELASTLSLAGSEGAKVRTSLAAKARAIRRRRMSEADGAAQAATEQMSLPVVGLFAAFLLLIGYPALAHVLSMS